MAQTGAWMQAWVIQRVNTKTEPLLAMLILMCDQVLAIGIQVPGTRRTNGYNAPKQAAESPDLGLP